MVLSSVTRQRLKVSCLLVGPICTVRLSQLWGLDIEKLAQVEDVHTWKRPRNISLWSLKMKSPLRMNLSVETRVVSISSENVSLTLNRVFTLEFNDLMMETVQLSPQWDWVNTPTPSSVRCVLSTGWWARTVGLFYILQWVRASVWDGAACTHVNPLTVLTAHTAALSSAVMETSSRLWGRHCARERKKGRRQRWKEEMWERLKREACVTGGWRRNEETEITTQSWRRFNCLKSELSFSRTNTNPEPSVSKDNDLPIEPPGRWLKGNSTKQMQ